VVIVCAGMDGALPSVVGGLVKAPVIAVPTSVGYGAAFHGRHLYIGNLGIIEIVFAVICVICDV
jgi:NCAIR mutase (PurE)-related protein